MGRGASISAFLVCAAFIGCSGSSASSGTAVVGGSPGIGGSGRGGNAAGAGVGGTASNNIEQSNGGIGALSAVTSGKAQAGSSLFPVGSTLSASGGPSSTSSGGSAKSGASGSGSSVSTGGSPKGGSLGTGGLGGTAKNGGAGNPALGQAGNPGVSGSSGASGGSSSYGGAAGMGSIAGRSNGSAVAGSPIATDPSTITAVSLTSGTSTQPYGVRVELWDPRICRCTHLTFEKSADCAYGVRSGELCLTQAQICNSRESCFNMTSVKPELIGALSVTGTAEVTADLKSVALQLDMQLPESAGEPRSVVIDFDDCRVGLTREDCRFGSIPVTSRHVEIRQLCGVYEIEVFEPEGFYIGALDYVLNIGKSCWAWIIRRRSDTKSYVYQLTPAEFDAIADGTPIRVAYGSCNSTKPIDNTEYGVVDKSQVVRY